jgi:hypothetical protein
MSCPTPGKFIAKPKLNVSQNTASIIGTLTSALDAEANPQFPHINVERITTNFETYFRDISDEHPEEKEIGDIIAIKVAEAVDLILVEVSLTAINRK